MLTTTFQLPDLSACWDQSQGFRQANDRWTAYCNQLAIAVVKPFLSEVVAPLTVRSALSGLAQASQWSCVTGTGLLVGDQRWLVLPTEQIDDDEIEIPQEWMDIADWAIDKIVAVTVNPDDLSARIVGFAHGSTVRSAGVYQPISRTYALDRDHWVSDFATLQVIEQLADSVDLTVETAVETDRLITLPTLTIAQAQNLIPRIADARLPRLAIPFTSWAALIQNPGWRQHFHQLRQTGEAPRSVMQWLRSGLDNFSLDMGWQSLNVAMAGTRSAGALALMRVLTIEGLHYELRILPGAEEGEWRFELRSLEANGGIPAGLMLRLMTEDLQGFEGNEAIATEVVDCLWIEVSLDPGEALIWEIEPTPEEGDRELIQF